MITKGMPDSFTTIELPRQINELAYVDPDIAERFAGPMMAWVGGLPTQMQLIKELRLLREAIAKRDA